MILGGLFPYKQVTIAKLTIINQPDNTPPPTVLQEIGLRYFDSSEQIIRFMSLFPKVVMQLDIEQLGETLPGGPEVTGPNAYRSEYGDVFCVGRLMYDPHLKMITYPDSGPGHGGGG
jgi:hypothetical protein